MGLKSAGFGVVLTGVVLLAACDSSTGTPAPAEPVAPAAAVAPVAETAKFPPGDNKFETWSMIGAPVVHDAAAEAPDKTMIADAVDMKLNDGLVTVDLRPINIGDTRKGSIYLWSSAPRQVALQLVNSCSKTPLEVETKNIELSATPTEYTISHTFANKHDCNVFQFILIEDVPSTIYAWNARVE